LGNGGKVTTWHRVFRQAWERVQEKYRLFF